MFPRFASRPIAPLLPAERECRAALELGWFGALVTLGAGMVASWALGATAVSVPLVFLALFICAGTTLAVEAILEQSRRWATFPYAIEAGQVVRVLALTIAWHLTGGIDSPALLVAFVPPMLGAIFAMRTTLPWVTAAAATSLTLATTLLESPEIRWFALQRGAPVHWLIARMPVGGLGRAGGGALADYDPAAGITALLLFAAAMISLAWLARPLIGCLHRVWELEEGKEVGSDVSETLRAMIRDNPTPVAVVHPDDGRIVAANHSFYVRMLVRRDAQGDRTLFECLSFATERTIRKLVAKPSDEPVLARYAVGTEERTARIQVHSLVLGDARYTAVTVIDCDELAYMAMAIDSMRDPLLIVRETAQVAYFNAAAKRVCPYLHFGMDAAQVPSIGSPLPGWWTADTPVDGGFKIKGRRFAVETTRLGGRAGSEVLMIVRLRGAVVTRRAARRLLEMKAS